MADDVSNDSSFNAASRNPHSEHELLLYELETSDTSSVGLVVRAIYEGDEYEKFMERLDARIKNHDRDIERMCNFHYQGFIDSIRELLQVRTKAQKLKQSEQSTVDVDFKWKNKKRKAPPPPNPFTGEIEQFPDESSLDDGDDLSAQDMIDFSPVYRCLHIHTVLDCSTDTSLMLQLKYLIMLFSYTLRDARADAESQIYERLNEKIDEFLELANYDWLLSEPEGQASSYLSDLIAFLKSTFEAFTNLPLLDLFTDWDWSNYFREYGQENSKYLRVNPQTAIIILEKIYRQLI
ncbi:Exocyst complex component 6B like protein [Argiope bruennichi]|uniref:Exocyst complex component 6B like protein n=1 Tax=Argiope bruennichi TaxID=94029 RepID=A0A8T0ED65_ARGBR|nr:Exocyst complex component 6B like protein [Argiope bruennichi]